MKASIPALIATLSLALVAPTHAAAAKAARTAPASAPAAAAPTLAVHSIALPGAAATGVYMDYIACDRPHHRVWVPAGNTASVDVIDTATEKLTRVEGFATKEMERNGNKRTVGPSSVTVGDGVVYVGNRGDSS